MSQGKTAAKDGGTVKGDESMNVVTLTQAELDEMLAKAAAEGSKGNLSVPAVEEGPHLKDPEIAAAKREQIKQAIADPEVDFDESHLTEDMAAVLAAKE